MTLIRPLSPKHDLDKVVALWCQASIDCHDFAPAWFWQEACAEMRDVYLPQAKTWVMVDDDSIVGFISTQEHHIAALFVKPEYQNRGIGTALLAHVLRRCDVATLEVYAANTRALLFYKQHGFRVTGEGVDDATGALEYFMEYRAGR